MENFIDNAIINILIILFIYLVLCTFYFLFSILISTKKKHIGIEQKFIAKDLLGNIVIIIYAKDGDSEVIDLVKMLEKQNYPKHNYQIHVLFDNSNDDYAEILENKSSAKIWKIKNGTVMGKDRALSWLLEKLISFRNVNAFVFLDANRVINRDFLEKVNEALFYSDIVVPAKEYLCSKGDFISLVKNTGIKYYNKIFNTSRAVLKLINPIDSGAVAIKQEVLEIVKCVDFKNPAAEFEYTVFLASQGFKAIFSPDVKTKINYQDDISLSLKDKFAIVKYLFSKIFTGHVELTELLFTFLKPSALLLIVLYFGFFIFLYNFEVRNMFFYDVKYIAIAAIINIVLFIVSLIQTYKDNINPMLLVLNPIYSLLSNIFKKFEDKDKDKEIAYVPHDDFVQPIGESTTVIVSDGHSDLKCSIELKNSGDGLQAVFRYKSNVLESKKHASYFAAINEITSKLSTNSLKMKICVNCAHFDFKPNSENSTQCGLCSQKDNMTDNIEKATTMLESCEHFETISEINNIVDFPKNTD